MNTKKQILFSFFILLFNLLHSNVVNKERYKHLKSLPILYDACTQVPQYTWYYSQTNAASSCDSFNLYFNTIKETGDVSDVPTQPLLESITLQAANASHLYHILPSLSKEQVDEIMQKNIDSRLSNHEKVVTILQMIYDHEKQLQKEWQEKNNK